MAGTVVVIGGGVVGTATALSLADRGFAVEVLEAGTIGGGCSRGNCGYLCPSHVRPLAVPGAVRHAIAAWLGGSGALRIAPRFDLTLWRWLLSFARRCRSDHAAESARGRHALLRSSRDLYRRLEERGFDGELEETGLLLVYRSPREFDAHGKTAALLAEEFSIPTEPFAGDALNDFEPSLQPGLAGGWWYPEDAQLHPERVLSSLRSIATAAGVQFTEECPVHRLHVEGERIVAVETAFGDRQADQFVLAAGSLTPRLTAEIGLRLPIQPGKGYSITMAPPRTVPQRPMVFEDHHVAVTPFRDTFRLGSTMEFAGYDRSLSPDRIALLRRSAAAHLIDPGGEAIEEWWGWRPMTPDDLPCLGRAPAVKNLHVAAGNGMIGLSTAPATGELIAELIAGEKPHLDPRPYALDRF